MITAISQDNFSHIALVYGVDIQSGVIDLGSVTVRHLSGSEFLLDTDGYCIKEDGLVVANLRCIDESAKADWENDFNMSLEQLLSGDVAIEVFVGDDCDCITPLSIHIHLIDQNGDKHVIACKPE
ncbi:hypothetical protein LMH73_028205 [Vibrio splendidus]|nr:hypothetical protein [Vibrio splendidus]MCC4883216.1 hypothetical protein [Vibrio splendidus]